MSRKLSDLVMWIRKNPVPAVLYAGTFLLVAIDLLLIPALLFLN